MPTLPIVGIAQQAYLVRTPAGSDVGRPAGAGDWAGTLDVVPEVTLLQPGGHFPGSAAVLYIGWIRGDSDHLT